MACWSHRIRSTVAAWPLTSTCPRCVSLSIGYTCTIYRHLIQLTRQPHIRWPAPPLLWPPLLPLPPLRPLYSSTHLHHTPPWTWPWQSPASPPTRTRVLPTWGWRPRNMRPPLAYDIHLTRIRVYPKNENNCHVYIDQKERLFRCWVFLYCLLSECVLKTGWCRLSVCMPALARHPANTKWRLGTFPFSVRSLAPSLSPSSKHLAYVVKRCPSMTKFVLVHRYFRYLHQANTFVFRMISAVKWINFQLPSRCCVFAGGLRWAMKG